MIPDRVRACAVALVALPGVGPARLAALVDRAGDLEQAWALVRAGRLDDVALRSRGDKRSRLIERMVAAARATDAAELLAAHRRAHVEVLLPGDPSWPEPFVDDPEPPGVLFVRGDVGLLGQPAAAVVGTRRCTAAGVHVARSIGAGLADAGVNVISGLALGIDGAAHRAALAAGGRPIGVVGSGLDRVYPPRHAGLWAEVAEVGALCSEAPLGSAPERWRFPARNRLIAALADVTVVVESRRRGGSMTTVEAALERGRPVLAVPGSVLAEQSAGTNQLLAEGAGVARDAADVVAALGARAPVVVSSAPTPVGDSGTEPAGLVDPVQRAVAAALGPGPAQLEGIAVAVDATVADTVVALARLEAAGVARRAAGGYERVVP